MTTADLVKDTSTSVGAGNITVSGTPPTGFRPFTTLPNAAVGIKFGYKVANRAVPSEVEVGTGTIVALSPFQYSRAPANGATAIVFSAGTKDVEQVVTASEFNDFAKISEGITASALNDAGPLQASDMILIERGGLAYRSTLAAVATLLGSAADTTAPTLSSATAAANGPNAATGSVTTNEGNGTLFSIASANASETSAAVIAAGIQQAITSAGAKTVAVSGLAANTTYRLHHAHRDQYNNVAANATSSATFTTAAAIAVPSTMSAPIITGGDGKVSIAWTVPALNGGTFVSAIFTASTGQTLTVNATTSPVDFTLPNGTAVTVSGKVTNSVGPAAASSPVSNSVMPAAVVAGPAYRFEGAGSYGGFPSTLAFGGQTYTGFSCDFKILTAAGVEPDPDATDMYVTLSPSSTVMPRPNDANHSGLGNTFVTAGRQYAGNAAYKGYYGFPSLYTFTNFGGLANRFMHVLVFAKGADPTTATPIWAGVYDGVHTGTPIPISMTA